MRLNRVCPWSFKLLLLLFSAAFVNASIATANNNSNIIERRGIFELALNGPEGGNQFIHLARGPGTRRPCDGFWPISFTHR